MKDEQGLQGDTEEATRKVKRSRRKTKNVRRAIYDKILDIGSNRTQEIYMEKPAGITGRSKGRREMIKLIIFNNL